MIKKDLRHNKSGKVQRYYHRNCGGSFTLKEDAFHKMKNRPQIIALCLDLCFKGLSLRKIPDHLTQFYGIEASHMTIYRWIRKYVQSLKQYVDQTYTLSDFMGYMMVWFRVCSKMVV